MDNEFNSKFSRSYYIVGIKSKKYSKYLDGKKYYLSCDMFYAKTVSGDDISFINQKLFNRFETINKEIIGVNK